MENNLNNKKVDNIKKIEGEDISNLIIENKNKYSIVCARCPALILNRSIAEYKEIEVSIR